MTTYRPGYLEPPANPTGNPDLDELNSLLEALESHDDRGLVLALAAFVEDTLGRLLLSHLREEKQAKELVEGFNAPLGTFSARLKAALVFGLLHREQYDDLEILRHVRNRFAHDWQGISLDRNDIKSLIGKLNAIEFGNRKFEGDEREKLRGTIGAILIELRLLLKEIRKTGQRTPYVGLRMVRNQPVEVEIVLVDKL